MTYGQFQEQFRDKFEVTVGDNLTNRVKNNLQYSFVVNFGENLRGRHYVVKKFVTYVLYCAAYGIERLFSLVSSLLTDLISLH